MPGMSAMTAALRGIRGEARQVSRFLSTEMLLILPFVLFVGIFEIYPIINMAYRSLFDLNGNFTFENYINAFTKPQFQMAIRNSLLFATAASLVGGIGGTFVAALAVRLPARWRNLLLSLYALPMTLSGLVVAFAFIVLLGRNGVLNLLVRRAFGLPPTVYFNLYDWPGIVMVYAFFQIPLMTLSMAAVFENLDPNLIEAARNLGARPWQVWRYVVIPVLLPGFLAGMSIQFAGMMGAFGTVLALVGMAKNLLSLQIYSHASESTYNLPQAGALAMVLITITGVALILLSWGARRLARRGP
ncbi:MAG: ABC transporter permease subunit [Thermoflexus sp.]|jgi:putative spermidine/putrescine transport system permease protein|nr:ABC transporter permease subunit [Thermoflexus sp.]